MVGKLLSRLAIPVRGLHQAAYVLAGFTLASQALALLRDRTFAHLFGAGHTLDLYYAAFRIPDLVFVMVASLVSAYVLIPRISGATQIVARQLLSSTASFLVIVGGLFCLVLAFFAPELLKVLYPDLIVSTNSDSFILLTRILLIQPILLGLSGIFTSVTQVHRRFILFAISPVLYNLGIIFGAFVLFPYWGIAGIGYGVVLGATLHMALHIPILLHAKLFPKLIVPQIKEILSVMRDSVPRSLALSMGSITVLVLTVFAAKIGAGSVSVFTLAWNLESVPLALIGASYAVAAFPALSEASAREHREEFSRILSVSSRHIILWSIVALGLIVVLRAHLVRVILGTGAFDWDATRLTAAMLAIFAAGLVAQGLLLLFSRALYAVRESWSPLFYQLIGGITTIVIAWLLLSLPANGFPLQLATWFKVEDIQGFSILLIALSWTIGQMLAAVIALTTLMRIVPAFASSLARPFFHGVLSAFLGGLATYGVLVIEGGIAPLTTLLAVFTQGLVAGIVGVLVSGATLALLRNKEFKDMLRALRRFPAFQRVLAPSAEESAQP